MALNEIPVHSIISLYKVPVHNLLFLNSKYCIDSESISKPQPNHIRISTISKIVYKWREAPKILHILYLKWLKISKTTIYLINTIPKGHRIIIDESPCQSLIFLFPGHRFTCTLQCKSVSRKMTQNCLNYVLPFPGHRFMCGNAKSILRLAWGFSYFSKMGFSKNSIIFIISFLYFRSNSSAIQAALGVQVQSSQQTISRQLFLDKRSPSRDIEIRPLCLIEFNLFLRSLSLFCTIRFLSVA